MILTLIMHLFSVEFEEPPREPGTWLMRDLPRTKCVHPINRIVGENHTPQDTLSLIALKYTTKGLAREAISILLHQYHAMTEVPMVSRPQATT